MCLVCGAVTVCILLAIIIYDESKARITCLKKVSVKTNRKILSLAVKLDVIRRIEEAGECHIDVCKALDLAGSTVQCILKK
jgi:hypothetical protein